MSDRTIAAPDARTPAQQLSALDAVLDAAIDAGIDLIQIREPDLPARTLLAFVSAVVIRTRPTPARVLVNDRADVAIAARADGVHLKSDGPAASTVRKLEGVALVGRSIHPPQSEDAGCDYVIAGTVFPSASKPGGPVLGVGGLTAAISGLRVPVLAIGGITPINIGKCREAGAAGIAGIRVFLPLARTRDAIRALRAAWDLR